MKFICLVLLFVSASAVTPSSPARGSHPYEFVQSGSPRDRDFGAKTLRHDGHVDSEQRSAGRKSGGRVPPYAVSMEPLVKYSQPDPLYNGRKGSARESKVSDTKNSDFIRIKKEDFDSENTGEFRRIASKSDQVVPYDESGIGSSEHHQVPEYGGHPSYYEGHYHDPEPIIEIIIRESNQSLPAPPPPPPAPKKKKKEPVQVYYVKYKKEPSSHYGGGKIVYEAPVPAITPPTNNENDHEEEKEEEYEHHHHHVPVTLPPRPSTTLKAIIRPDSETYHGSGLHITFGKPKDEESGYGSDQHHYASEGGYEEQSAPQPSVSLPPGAIQKVAVDSQLTKRNPTPFQSQAQPPQQSFNGNPSISAPRDFYKPTVGPIFHQSPRFSVQPQPFRPQSQQVSTSFPPSPPTQSPAPDRQGSAFRYTTLPQFQQFSKPQQSFSFPSQRHQAPHQPVAQPPVQSQQVFSIDQPHLKSSFYLNSRSTSQPYNTISSRVTHHGFGKSQTLSPSPSASPAFPHSKPFSLPTSNFFPKPTHSYPQQANSFPSSNSNLFSQTSLPQRVATTPQRNVPVAPSAIPPQQHQHQQQHHHRQQQQHQHLQHSQHIHQQHQNLQHQSVQQHHQHHLEQFQKQQHIEQLHQSQRQSQVTQYQQQKKAEQQRQHHIDQLNKFHHQQQIEQIKQFQRQQAEHLSQIQNQQQQRIQAQSAQDRQKQSFPNQQKVKSEYEPEIIKSISPDLPFTTHKLESNSQSHSTLASFRPQFQSSQFSQSVKSSTQQYVVPKTYVTTTESYKKYSETTRPPVEYITNDPKKAEEERRKKEERKQQNVAALPKEVPDDLREQLLSSDILGNADIQILDYDKIGDIPIDKLPPEALANFQAVAGSEPVPAVAAPEQSDEEVAEASEQQRVVVPPPSPDVMEMKVVRYNSESKEGAQLASQYMKADATQLEPVVLNDSKYNRYLPLKVAGAQFPVPDVPELRGKNVTSVVVLAPVDYEFLQRHDDAQDEGRAGRSSHPVLEVQGVHFVSGDVLKTLVKRPTSENYRLWLEKENKTTAEKQSVVLLVIEPPNNVTGEPKEIYMYDIATQKVSKLSGELSAQFVEVAESNSENDDLDEISDNHEGSFAVADTSQVPSPHVRTQRQPVAVYSGNTASYSSR